MIRYGSLHASASLACWSSRLSGGKAVYLPYTLVGFSYLGPLNAISCRYRDIDEGPLVAQHHLKLSEHIWSGLSCLQSSGEGARILYTTVLDLYSQKD